MSTTPEKREHAVADLRAALEPIRLADSHEDRLEALGRAQRNLFMLWKLEWIDRETFDALLVEIEQADSAGVRRCEAKRT